MFHSVALSNDCLFSTCPLVWDAGRHGKKGRGLVGLIFRPDRILRCVKNSCVILIFLVIKYCNRSGSMPWERKVGILGLNTSVKLRSQGSLFHVVSPSKN